MDEISRYREEFIREAREYLDAMNQNFINLEKGDRSSMDEIFRLAHTIKGMAGFMEYKKIEELCHRLESVMGSIRDGKVEITEEIMDILLSAVDSLELLLDSVESNGRDEGDISEALEGLKSLMELNESDSKRKSHDAQSNSGTHRGAIRIDLILSDDCVMKSVRATLILKTLKEFGEIIETVPNEEALENGDFDREFSVVIKTKKIGEIEEALSRIGEIEKFEIIGLNEERISDGVQTKGEQKTLRKLEKNDEVMRKERKVEFVRVNITQLDKIMNLVGELVINKGRLSQISSDYNIPELKEAVAIMDKIISNLQDEVMQMRMEKIERVFSKFPRMVRDLSRKLGKKIELIMKGLDTELDRTVLDQMNDPLIHIVRNCVDHGIETPEERKALGKDEVGRIKILAYRDRNNIIIEIEDDGRGLDLEKIKRKALEKGLVTEEKLESMSEEEIKMLIFAPGFSTKDSATEISGRGVGMDVVKTTVEKLGGSINLSSEKNKGMKIRIQLPPTVAITKSLLIKVGGETYAIPISNVVEALYVSSETLKNIHGTDFMLVRGKLVPAFRLREIFGVNGETPEKEVAIVVERGNEKFALIADAITDQQEIVIKPLYGYLAKIKGFNGVTILGDGRVVPILDVSTLIKG